ncbi:unnamed protein product [Protopolystoma xenopodis]|uniref:Uncharacterized protein n=1 Tax=Protopolystoma xenopodis TaxID=117903 RepID=A0A3S5C4E1_9PLAT|nr:unnamed protein product [Protopolystoma xenopodis]
MAKHTHKHTHTWPALLKNSLQLWALNGPGIDDPIGRRSRPHSPTLLRHLMEGRVSTIASRFQGTRGSTRRHSPSTPVLLPPSGRFDSAPRRSLPTRDLDPRHPFRVVLGKRYKSRGFLLHLLSPPIRPFGTMKPRLETTLHSLGHLQTGSNRDDVTCDVVTLSFTPLRHGRSISKPPFCLIHPHTQSE